VDSVSPLTNVKTTSEYVPATAPLDAPLDPVQFKMHDLQQLAPQ